MKRLWILALDLFDTIRAANPALDPAENEWILTTERAFTLAEPTFQPAGLRYHLFHLSDVPPFTALATWPNFLKGVIVESQPQTVYLDYHHPLFQTSLQICLEARLHLHILLSQPLNPADFDNRQIIQDPRFHWHCLNEHGLNFLLAEGVRPMQIFPHASAEIDWVLQSEKQAEIQISGGALAPSLNLPEFYLLPKHNFVSESVLELEKAAVIYTFLNPDFSDWQGPLDAFVGLYQNQDPIALVLIPHEAPGTDIHFDDLYQGIESWYSSQTAEPEQMPEVILLDPADFSGFSGIPNPGILFLNEAYSLATSLALALQALSAGVGVVCSFQALNQLLSATFESLKAKDLPEPFDRWQKAFPEAHYYPARDSNRVYYVWNSLIMAKHHVG